METGQKPIQKTNNKIDHIKLSIQVSLNGFSFCILDDNSNVVFYDQIGFDKKQTPTELLSQLTASFNNKPELQQDFENVVVIHDNELSTLVPNELFDEAHLADYLKFNSRILQTDFITFDSLKSIESKNVYVPYVNVNNFVYEHFGAFSYHHTSSILIEGLITHNTPEESVMYAHFTNSHFEIVILQGKKLQFYNSFDYQSNEDVIYYLLFTAEQMQLNPESFKLYLLGHIKEDNDLFELIYSYVRHTSLMPFKDDSILSSMKGNFIQANSF